MGMDDFMFANVDRLDPKTSICRSIHFGMQIKECEAGTPRRDMSAAARRLSSHSNGALKRCPRGDARGHLPWCVIS